MRKRSRGITFVEICLSLTVFGIGLSVSERLYAFYHQQNKRIYEMELIPIYVNCFTFFRSIHAIDRSGEWFACQDALTKERYFSQTCPQNVDCPFMFKLELSPTFAKTFQIRVFSTSSKRQLLSYLEEIL